MAPMMIFNNVDLPAPFDPTSPIRSCGPIMRETSSKRTRPPYCMFTWSRESIQGYRFPGVYWFEELN
jgi:hypothetical protein